MAQGMRTRFFCAHKIKLFSYRCTSRTCDSDESTAISLLTRLIVNFPRRIFNVLYPADDGKSRNAKLSLQTIKIFETSDATYTSTVLGSGPTVYIVSVKCVRTSLKAQIVGKVLIHAAVTLHGLRVSESIRRHIGSLLLPPRSSSVLSVKRTSGRLHFRFAESAEASVIRSGRSGILSDYSGTRRRDGRRGEPVGLPR